MNPRTLLAVPALLALVACGSSKLTQGQAEQLIKPDYPVLITIKVPKQVTQEKGSAEQQRTETVNGMLDRSGVFNVQRSEEGTKVHYVYTPAPSASGIQATDRTYLLPAAEVSFVKPLRVDQQGNRYNVTYQIRLAKPTPHFGLYQFLHPNAPRVGETKERHAVIEKQGANFALMSTDETLKSKD